MAHDDRIEDAFDLDKVPRPDATQPGFAPPELPEPSLSPPDVGELELLSPPAEPLVPPALQQQIPGDEDLPFPVDDPANRGGDPGEDNLPFPVGAPGDRAGDAGEESNGESVQLLTRLVEIAESYESKLDEIIEKLEGVGTFGP